MSKKTVQYDGTGESLLPLASGEHREAVNTYADGAKVLTGEGWIELTKGQLVSTERNGLLSVSDSKSSAPDDPKKSVGPKKKK